MIELRAYNRRFAEMGKRHRKETSQIKHSLLEIVMFVLLVALALAFLK